MEDKKTDGMKCICGKIAVYREDLEFDSNKIKGWKCESCNEEFYDPDDAQKILVSNKLKYKINQN